MNKKSNKTSIIVIMTSGILILALILCITYAWSKFSNANKGLAEAQVAKWTFNLRNINGEAITEGEINFPITRIDNNQTVEQGKIAPGTYGMFHVIVDTKGTEVSLLYDIDISITKCPQNIIFYQDQNTIKNPKYFDNVEQLESYLQEEQQTCFTNPNNEDYTIEVFKTDTTKKKVTITDNILNIKRFMPIKPENDTQVQAGKIYLETIYWEWPYITQDIFNEDFNGDLIDSESIGKEFIMNIAVTGVQMNENYLIIDKDKELIPVTSMRTSGSYYKAEPYASTIKRATFVDYIDTSNATMSWDISAKKNGSIMAWVEPDGDYYNLYIGTKGIVQVIDNRGGLMFANLTALETINFNGLIDTSKAYDLSDFFSGDIMLKKIDMESLNLENNKNFSYFFANCKSLTSLNLKNLNTASATNMNYMFRNCENLLSLDLSDFNTTNVTQMISIFDGCKKLESINLSSFNTINVTNMQKMFNSCNSLLNLDLSSFNTNNVNNFSGMFNGCSSLTSLNISNFNTSNATTISGMFSNCLSLLELDISNFNTSNVTDMKSLFYLSKSLKRIYISDKWDTSNVTEFASMFYGCTSLVGGNGTAYKKNTTESIDYAIIDGKDGFSGLLTSIESKNII